MSEDGDAGGSARDRQITGTVVAVEREFIRIEVNGREAHIYASELMLGVGETPAQRYAPGDQFNALVFQMTPDPASGLTQFSIRRAAPYPDALSRSEVASVVDATVINTYDAGIELDIGGLRGNAYHDELPLQLGESPHQRYEPGQTIEGLLVWRVDHETRELALSAKRNAPGYVDALRRRAVGDVVSATVTSFHGNGCLVLDVEGLVSVVPPDELALADGESVWDRYTIGETIEGLFVWQVNYEDRVLDLSVKRNAPGYVEALQRHAVGDVVSATVTDFQPHGGLWVNVDGLVGAVELQQLALADEESAQERHPIGSTIDQLFIFQVDHDVRVLHLSVLRSTSGYIDALNTHRTGDVVSGVVTLPTADGGFSLDIDGVSGTVSPGELPLADRESAQERYSIGSMVDQLFIFQVDHDARTLHLSVRRSASDYVDALNAVTIGDSLTATILHMTEWGVWLDANGVVGWIPTSELPLDHGQTPRDRYQDGQTIRARVWQIDELGRDIILSVRRLAADFVEESVVLGEPIDAAVRGTTSRDIPMPIRVMAANHEVWIPAHELALTIGVPTQFKSEDTIRPIVVAVDEDGRPTSLSLRRALDGWGTAVERLSASNFLVTNARILPYDAVTQTELRDGSAAVDLGPILGLISREELSLETGEVLMRQSGNLGYGVVVDSIDRERGFAYVSHNRFEERWREVAGQLELEEDVEVDGELRDFDGETALHDLGSGLLAQMPARELPDSDPPGKAARDRIGEHFPLRITAIDRDKQTVHVEHGEQPIVRLINQGESEKLEFKATLRRSPRTGEDDKGATFGVMKSIVGFLNSWDGGTLLVGVDDAGIPITGPNDELGTLAIDRYTSEDEMIRALKDLIRRRIGASVFKWLTIAFTDFRSTRILRVDCEPADSEVWLKGGKNGTSNQEEFFLRTPAATDPLDGRELVNYIQRRFSSSPAADD